MKSYHFIISRYKEKVPSKEIFDLATRTIEESNVSVFVYDKFEKQEDTYKLVPNLGREHYGWFKHILDTWDNPPDFYGFTHPCSSTYRPDKFDLLRATCENVKEMIREERSFSTHVPLVRNWRQSFSLKRVWVGNTPDNIPDVERQTYVMSEYPDLDSWWIKNFPDVPLPDIRCTGGICIGSSQNIQSWGKDLWSHLFDEVSKFENGELSHYLERTMLRLAMGKKIS
jgi:hypothetical protein